jgi:hypothetical protein
MATSADWSMKLAHAVLSREEEEYLALVLEAARLENQALDLAVDARLYDDPARLKHAAALHSQSRALLDDLQVKKAGIDARREILGIISESSSRLGTQDTLVVCDTCVSFATDKR